MVWARRDGLGWGVVSAAPVAAVLAGVVASAVLAGTAVLLSATAVAAGVLVFVALSDLSASPVVVPACVCYSSVVRGCMASAMAVWGIVALSMDMHASAQSR